LALLVDNSLLRRETGVEGEPRFVMLETIRKYALERLAASGTEADIRHRHASFFLAQAEGSESELREPAQGARLATDYDNFCGALAWLIACEELALACRLWLVLRDFWWTRGHLTEGRRWLVPLMANLQSIPATILMRVFDGAGWLAYWQGDYAAARTYREDALALARESGDELGMADALFYLGEVSNTQGDHDAARDAWETGLTFYRAPGSKDGIAATFIMLGQQARELGDARQAAAHYEESLALFRETDNMWGSAVARFNLGFAVQQQDDWERAGALFRASLVYWQESGGDAWGIAHCLVGLAGVAGARGQLERAARLFGATEALLNTTGLRLEPVDQIQQDRNIAVARAQLDDATFAAAWAAGRALTLEQAVAEALDR